MQCPQTPSFVLLERLQRLIIAMSALVGIETRFPIDRM